MDLNITVRLSSALNDKDGNRVINYPCQYQLEFVLGGYCFTTAWHGAECEEDIGRAIESIRTGEKQINMSTKSVACVPKFEPRKFKLTSN